MYRSGFSGGLAIRIGSYGQGLFSLLLQLAAAASLDSSGGLFPSRSELPILPDTRPDVDSTGLLVLLKKHYQPSGYSSTEWESVFKDSKLNERAWTLQERELSRRILYFTKHSMLFECREARAIESPLLQTLKVRRKTAVSVDPTARRILDKVF
jgi:hypothetical protein